MVKSFIIDPFKKEVKEFKGKLTSDKMHKLLNCKTFCGTWLKNGDFLYVDDIGLLDEENKHFYIAGQPQSYAGYGLVVGYSADDEDVDAKFTLKELKQVVGF